ncbi:hypothetical protein [Actinotalea sp. K2]|uniref:hypothetical protein n=1 Tax=Actinotalea sp. K2 TaxID=2939438 RepID=UPI002016D66B|nr:hypothetical protein [Actinotalea sp. K2]MCL3860636.1 hypothetical protein [Actinotalea sp. K2]
MDVTEVADELYAVPLPEFIAARDARAKALRADGDRELATQVRRLGRPSTAAWAVNQLVRARRDQVEQLLALGTALQEAQAALSRDDLRELDRQRHRLVAAVRREAQAVAAQAGQRLSETVARDVEATLRAGMADAAAADAVRSGRLLRSLSSTGFEPVDVTGAIALPGGGATPSKEPEARAPRAPTRSTTGRESGPTGTDDELASRRRRREAEAEQRRTEDEARRRREEQRRAERREAAREALAHAEADLAVARHDLDDAQARIEDLTRRRTRLTQRAADLRRRLVEAEREEDAVAERLAEAASGSEAASAALAIAERARAAAAKDLDLL